MKENKGKLIAYWIVTVLVAANYGFAGYAYIGRNPEVLMGAKALGYPVYFFVMLGVWKALGAIAILIPKTPIITRTTPPTNALTRAKPGGPSRNSSKKERSRFASSSAVGKSLP